MRKRTVESAKVGSWIFHEGGWLSILSTGTGKTWLLVETVVSSPPIVTHQIGSLGPGGWVIFFFFPWFKTWSMASKKNSSSNSIKEMTWVIACFWRMICSATQVTFLSGCTGKKVPSKTLISIFFSWGGGNPFPLKITSLTLLVHEETLIKDKISFLIHRGTLLMFLIFVNSGIEWYRRFHIQPHFFF